MSKDKNVFSSTMSKVDGDGKRLETIAEQTDFDRALLERGKT